ncbi:MlaC/ttg2D family ABC transporter substrate-binding protein [Benzoatithermus flavus]|uniref:ABC transporter substrate-binding protein n=1 Tax=Benzoatithermus flavus TaxID=3108223 RepID=A0ABU8XWJ6_9PROT
MTHFGLSDTTSRRGALLGAAAALLLSSRSGLAAIADASATPREFIQRLGDRTVQILNEPQSENARKLQELKRLLDEATDLDLIARLVMGRYWREASETQKAEYLELFRALVMQTMAERFSWYTGETFEITDAKPVDERDTIVSTRINRTNGKPPILVDWRVRKGERGYLLVDIVAEGVSLVVTQRSEAAEIIGRSGIDGLLAEMRKRIARRDAGRSPTGT